MKFVLNIKPFSNYSDLNVDLFNIVWFLNKGIKWESRRGKSVKYSQIKQFLNLHRFVLCMLLAYMSDVRLRTVHVGIFDDLCTSSVVKWNIAE